MKDDDDFRIITPEQAIFWTCAGIVVAALCGVFA